jgi:hypothetical protein
MATTRKTPDTPHGGAPSFAHVRPALVALHKDVRKGGRDLFRDVDKLVRSLRRDAPKLGKALRADLGQLAKSTKDLPAPPVSPARRRPATKPRRPAGSRPTKTPA